MKNSIKENQTPKSNHNKCKIESVVICAQEATYYPGFITDLKLLVDAQPAGNCKIKLFIRKGSQNTHKTTSFRSFHSSAVFLEQLQSYFSRAIILTTY